MSRARTVPPVIEAPTHGGVIKPCIVMTESAIHTVTLDEGSFAAIVLSLPGSGSAVLAILDEDEVEAHIMFLRNAIADAKLIDAGKAPIHAAQSLRRS
ncbi:MAG: hypothetical protein ACJ8DZ_13775 [Allosphingosinicella sp.]